jgi:hypothetical protein
VTCESSPTAAPGAKDGIAFVRAALLIAITAIAEKLPGREASPATRLIQAESRATLPAMPQFIRLRKQSRKYTDEHQGVQRG